ncbi:E3 ubiquitin-protein ligase TRIM9-like isoform X3 [Macrobrachium nipponense]|uniref:E3 ubiquitin-protein ligase TRIM9-like isoform X3 n=1 Tax=Macrobrachium nipponense TaxID=159736 RepID=UPI0030C8AC36
MEEELRCSQCSGFYHVPVLLVCHHALCLACAGALQKPAAAAPPPPPPPSRADEEGSSSSGGSSLVPPAEEHETSEVDKLSVLSDADSGVSCSSRPTSLVGASEERGGGGGSGGGNSISNNSDPPPPPPVYTITCPKCGVATPTDESGAQGLTRFRVLAAVVDKHLERYQVAEPCQLCEGAEMARAAQVFCDQCLVFYCGPCRDSCHPARGPLASHWLVSVAEGRALLRARRREREGRCGHHPQEHVSMFCVTCRVPVCVLCLHHGRHHTHDVHALNAVTKTHKTELSQALQQLSEKARAATEFIHTLKTLSDEVHGNCREVEGVIAAQVDALVEALQTRRSDLINWVRRQRDAKVHALREQVQDYTHTLQGTTATIHFCIEALKESDPASFMEAQAILEERVCTVSEDWERTMIPEPRVPPVFNLTLDDKTLLTAIQQLTFIQLKPPGTPAMIPEECSAENNSVTIAWAPHHTSCVTGYTLEIDDGSNGPFREVYTGEETVCTIDGLHFNSIYRARVKAFNNSGSSAFCEPLCLQTAAVAWFTFETNHADHTLSENGCTVSCDSYEHRVALGSVGFSRGIHYWEFHIERYDGNADIAFGVGRIDICKEMILGKCGGSWSMYIDGERSWFMHGGEHFDRKSGGVRAGDTVGLLLILPEKTLTFYVNGDLQGRVSLAGIGGVLYPAVSLNRSVVLTVQTGLHPPKKYLNPSSEANM